MGNEAKASSGRPNRGSGMSWAQWQREMGMGDARQYGEAGGRRDRGTDWGPSGPAETGSTRINDLAQLLANKGLLNVATAQIAADADLSAGTRLGNAQRRDRLTQAAQRDLAMVNPSKDSYYRGPKRAGNTGKAGSGFGGREAANRMSAARQWATRDMERDAARADEMAMERFRANLRQEELAKRISLLSGLLSGGNARRTTDTATREELVNIAGRPEKRSLSSSQTKDNSMDILQQIMRMI